MFVTNRMTIQHTTAAVSMGMWLTLPQQIRIWMGALLCAAVMSFSTISATAQEEVDKDKVYQVLYNATFDPEAGIAHSSITIKQHRRLVRSIEFYMPKNRYKNIRPASRIEVDGDRVTWKPQKKGSTLEFDFIVDHNRSNGEADARITDTWALLKLDHLFPRASARVVKGATSEASLVLDGPKGWAIETPYGYGAGTVFNTDNPDRNYDRPLGWMMAGKLGIRREKIGERYISVASPLGTDVRANDVLSFLRWTLPSLFEVLPGTAQRLLIVSGTQDMWRGGLSGVGSLYLHPDRPLISGNRTSSMLHELFHVGSGMHGKDGADWIVEGLAEYYSLTILLRSDGISQFRYDEALDTLAQWSEDTQCVATDRSQGKQTARAVLVMHALDGEIRSQTDNEASLDTLVENLVQANKTITNADFRTAAQKLTGDPVRALANCP